MQVKVTVKGARELARAFGDDGLMDKALRPGFKKAAVVVEGAWKEKTHIVTGKYRGSLGHEVVGVGASLKASIGPQPGLGQPRKYTAAMTAHWETPRSGVNEGDPQEYAQYEDRRHGNVARATGRNRGSHSAVDKVVEANEDRIEDIIQRSVDEVLNRF